jgi:hypothetical protein
MDFVLRSMSVPRPASRTATSLSSGQWGSAELFSPAVSFREKRRSGHVKGALASLDMDIHAVSTTTTVIGAPPHCHYRLPNSPVPVLGAAAKA